MANILVVDDDRQVCDLLKQVLEDRGDTVTCATNGVEGIKEYRSHPADLIILDILMPEKEGLETILDLRREFPQVKIIAMSGGSERGSHGDCSRPRERSCAGHLARKVSSGLYARIIGCFCARRPGEGEGFECHSLRISKTTLCISKLGTQRSCPVFVNERMNYTQKVVIVAGKNNYLPIWYCF